MSEENKNPDSFDEAVTDNQVVEADVAGKNLDEVVAEENAGSNVSEQEQATLQDVLQALRANEARMNELAKENERLRQRQDVVEDEEEDVEPTRRPAETITIATYDGKPVVDMRLEKNVQKDHNGNSYIKNYTAHLTLHGQEEPVEVTYGELSEPDDFLNLPRKTFKLKNQNPADLSGASRVEHNVITSRGEKVDEVDRSSGLPVKTGKQVQLVTRNDIRYYTIDVDGEDVELRQDKIYR